MKQDIFAAAAGIAALVMVALGLVVKCDWPVMGAIAIGLFAGAYMWFMAMCLWYVAETLVENGEFDN